MVAGLMGQVEEAEQPHYQLTRPGREPNATTAMAGLLD